MSILTLNRERLYRALLLLSIEKDKALNFSKYCQDETVSMYVLYENSFNRTEDKIMENGDNFKKYEENPKFFVNDPAYMKAQLIYDFNVMSLFISHKDDVLITSTEIINI